MKPVHDLGNGAAHQPLRQLGAVDHDDRDAERSGRKDLRLGSGSARILCDQQFRAMRAHQPKVVLKPEGTACDDYPSFLQRKIRGRRIDQPGQEAMLSQMREVPKVLAADCQERPLPGPLQCRHGSRHEHSATR